jgi:hypothetical protein
MQRNSIVLLLVLTGLWIFPYKMRASTPKTPEVKCELSDLDYAVYGGLIQGLGHPEDPEEAWQGKEILLLDNTGGPMDVESRWNGWGFRSKSQAAPSKETIADFKAKSNSVCAVEPKFGDPKSYRIITREEIDKTFTKDGGGWERFYIKYPQSAGFWSFSRPGYNSSRDEAVLFVGHSCGDLCGTGHLYFLTKENGKWGVKNRLLLWIS